MESYWEWVKSIKHIYFNKQEIDSWLLKNRKATIEEIQDTASNVITLKKGVRL